MYTYTVFFAVIIAISAPAASRIANGAYEDPSLSDPKLGQLVAAYMQISKLLPKLSHEEHREVVNNQYYQPQKLQVHQHPQHNHYVPEQPQHTHYVPQQPQHTHYVPQQPQHNHYVPQQHQQYIPPVTAAPYVENPGSQPRWTGPLADHVLGQQVQETPEVAAARHLHQAAYADIRAVLPEIPAEEDDDQHSVHHQVGSSYRNPVISSYHPTTARPVSYVKTQWGDFQEETPEVVAARREHEKAYAAALGR